MTSREYILAANPITWPTWPEGGRKERDIRTRADGGEWQVAVVVADEDSVGALGALRRAYQDGREDRSTEMLDENQRWQVGEARELLARWDSDHGDEDIYSTERTLADALRGMLALLGQVAADVTIKER